MIALLIILLLLALLFFGVGFAAHTLWFVVLVLLVAAVAVWLFNGSRRL